MLLSCNFQQKLCLSRLISNSKSQFSAKICVCFQIHFIEIRNRNFQQKYRFSRLFSNSKLTPLIFPIFIAITVFVLSTEESEERVITLLDSNNFIEDSTKFQNNIFLFVFDHGTYKKE